MRSNEELKEKSVTLYNIFLDVSNSINNVLKSIQKSINKKIQIFEIKEDTQLKLQEQIHNSKLRSPDFVVKYKLNQSRINFYLSILINAGFETYITRSIDEKNGYILLKCFKIFFLK